MSDIPADQAPRREASTIKGRSLWDDARRRLMRNPAAVASLYVLVVLVLLAAFGPMLWVHPVDAIFRDRVGVAPTFDHWHLLGTDTEGRDLVARTAVRLAHLAAGGACRDGGGADHRRRLGRGRRLYRRLVDDLMMRIVDVLYAIPFIFFVIVLMTVIDAPDPFLKLMLIFVAIGAVEWLTMARIVRGQTIALRKQGICRSGPRRWRPAARDRLSPHRAECAWAQWWCSPL